MEPTVFQALFHAAVQHEVFHSLKNHPHKADDPEALQLHHDAVHHAHADSAVGHFGQRPQRHIVLEQDVQVGLALFDAAAQQGAQHSSRQPADGAASVPHLAQRHVAVDVHLVLRDGTAQQRLKLRVRHVLHLRSAVMLQIFARIGVGCAGARHRDSGSQADIGAGSTHQQLIAAALHLPAVGLDIPVAERLIVQRDGDGLALSGFQLHLGKALQLLDRAENFCIPALLGALLFSGVAEAAPSIYPVDTARFLGGSRFDFKVEFDGELAEKDAKVLINGQDAKAVLGAKPEFIAKEKGADASALLLRGASLKPGQYKVTVESPTGKASANWDVYGTPDKPVAKNVILLIADGLSMGHRTSARLMSKGVTNGMYNGKLSMDTLPYTAMLGTCSVDSIAADSANTASAYMTGHKSSVNALGVYADRTPDSLDDPKQETIAELLRRTTGKSIGVVSDAEIEDATPASVVGHTRRRADKAEIVDMFYSVKPDVIIGGGSAYFLPQNVPGSKRKDDKNYVEMFQKEGYALATSNTELSKAVKGNPDKLLGLFHTGNMDGVLDRKFLKKGTVSKFPDQPDLTDSMRAALSVLSKNPEGFFLMLEAGLVDKYSHPLDWERAVYDTIMFDKVVAMAQEFCDKNPDTLLIVTGDHTHSISVIGTVDDNLPGELMRDKVGIYAEAGYPAYKDRNGDGYPDDVNVSKRLAVFIGNYPDYYETYRPKMDGPFVPSVKDEKGHYIANAAYKDVPGAQLRIGNLPRTESTGVHSIDDLVVGARGPHADAFRGFMNSTEVFRIMSEALALGNK